jgi:hypothetical protein
MNEKYIYNPRITDYMIARGVEPIAETKECATFKLTPQFSMLLEQYYIRNVLFKNLRK